VPVAGACWIWRPGIHCDIHQVPHNINFREKKPKPSKKKAEGGNTEEGSGVRSRVARFRYFEDIYGYSGVSRWFPGV
jgi:cleavage and polyadenylation specificity factor subunit 1